MKKCPVLWTSENIFASGFCVAELWTGSSRAGDSMQLCWMLSVSQKGNFSHKISSLHKDVLEEGQFSIPTDHLQRSETLLADLCSERCRQFEY